MVVILPVDVCPNCPADADESRPRRHWNKPTLWDDYLEQCIETHTCPDDDSTIDDLGDRVK
jgi:hypothetical protein